ncbi:MAG: PAS domain-containing protein [Deltaproteobacteria bacterium]|jgi:iron only hydrogenase large subunit-like protein|nr:PAS domain-containing protein [Deltaproteobacteria bacterium]
MIQNHPVYTVRNECQDCCKCLRHCPVKAIKVQDGRAEVMARRCIGCGRCVLECPGRAKRIRSDVDKAASLLSAGKQVFVSLAPSWRSFFDCGEAALIARLKGLGVSEVSETALSAQDVSIQTASVLRQGPPGLYVSSACPVIVDFIKLYKPRFARNVVPLASPALTHAWALKKLRGEDVEVVFVGPCVGKKNEADRRPDLLSAALTFQELEDWLSLTERPAATDRNFSFFPARASEGAQYPLEGGMNETLRRIGVDDDVQLVSISTIEAFEKALDHLDPADMRRKIFVEALACPGGCIAGPFAGSKKSVFRKMNDILDNMTYRETIPETPDFRLPADHESLGLNVPSFTAEEMQGALNRIGKYSDEDEKNCSGCGFSTCRELAQALLNGYAEPSMCVSYMRQLAARKAAVMLRVMPSALVMVDRELNIMEVNEAFIRMFAKDAPGTGWNAPEDFVGEPVGEWLEFAHLFKKVLKTGQEVQKEHVSYKKRLFDMAFFCIERNECAGALVTDVTVSESGREKIARRAREVIARNISTVQEIAGLLGEHMAETEMLLESIAEGYDVLDDEEPGED